MHIVSQTFLVESGSMCGTVKNMYNKLHISSFYGHSLPSTDSREAVVSFWQRNVHNTG